VCVCVCVCVTCVCVFVFVFELVYMYSGCAERVRDRLHMGLDVHIWTALLRERFTLSAGKRVYNGQTLYCSDVHFRSGVCA
jgi:hypothetical protein